MASKTTSADGSRRSLASSFLRIKKTATIGVLGCLVALASVVATPVVAGAAPVPCGDSGALVTAIAAVSASGGTVTLTAGCTYTITASSDGTDGPNAFADITGSVTIVGNGATITRSTAGGTPDFRFFIVDNSGTLDISNVTLSHGSTPAASGTPNHGGAAILNRNVLNVSGVTFLDNNSQASTGGGAIDNHDTGVLTVTNSTFSGNIALQGGAIEDEATLCHTTTPDCGRAIVTNSTFTNNSTTSFGGGGFESQLDAASPAVCVDQTTFPRASCQQAGGAHDTLTGNTFSGNTAITEGGGIANFGTMTVSNSTLYNNSAGSGGGGGVQNTGSISIVQSTIAANSSAFGANLHYFNGQPTASMTALAMTIVTAGVTGANCSTPTGGPVIVDNGYNLDSGTSCGFSTSNHSLNSTDPMLGPLASNGGPTQTMALMSGSPAINVIPTSFAGCNGSTDQRGVSRPQGAGCDIGAFETDNGTTPDSTPPSVPTNLMASTTNKPSVVLTWSASTDNVAVTGYTIYRDAAQIATVGGSTLTYEDTTVAPLTTYTYTVDAFDAAGNHSAQSASVNAQVGDTIAPSVPAGLTATAGATIQQVSLSWSASTDNVGVTGYTIYRDGTQVGTVSGSSLSFLDNTVAGLTSYSYTVDAFDAAGNHSAQSAAAAVTTPQISYLNWFDLASAGMYNDNVHLLNAGAGAASVTVSIAGTSPISVSVPAGTETYVTFGHGKIGGPVIVTSDKAIRASQRVQYFSTFNEVWAQTVNQAATTSYITWYDKASPGMFNDNIHLLNPSATSANVTVAVPGAANQSATVAPGAGTYVTFPAGTIGGPVTVTSDQPILASQRVQFYSSFNEVWAQGAGQAATTSYLNWYDKASPGMNNDNIHLMNPGGSTATVTVTLAGATTQMVDVAAGAGAYVTFPKGSIGGPVMVSSTQPVLASQRVQYYSTFNEVWAESAAQATTTSYVNWFDKASAGMNNDNIHLLNPGGVSASVTVSLPGATPLTATVAAGGEAYVSFPVGTIGGPVTITSDQPILASQRVQYFSSFNEIWSS